MKKLITLLFLTIALNAYSQSIFNGYWNLAPLNLGMWLDNEAKDLNLLLSWDFNLFSEEYLGDLGLGAELRTYGSDDSMNYDGNERIVELGGRLVYGYYFGTDKFGLYPYGGLTYGHLFDIGSNTTAILGARLHLWQGYGVYSEYVYNLDHRKSYITAGISLNLIAPRNFTPAPAPVG